MDQSDTFLERGSLKDYSCNFFIQIVKLIFREEYFHNDFFFGLNIYYFHKEVKLTPKKVKIKTSTYSYIFVSGPSQGDLDFVVVVLMFSELR